MSKLSSSSRYWNPPRGAPYKPVFLPPFDPLAMLKFFFGFEGYLFPTIFFFMVQCLFCYLNFTPPRERWSELQFDWILLVFVRNQALLWITNGFLHYLLYMKRVIGTQNKLNVDWPDVENKKFTFNNQVYDNIFWCCTSGVTFWTIYEVAYMYLAANEISIPLIGIVPIYYDWWEYPLYSFAMLFFIPMWREFHFYFVHRLIHYKPLYRWGHHVHHRNTSPGPWSGLSMHPVEHFFYFSTILPHFFLKSHPLHYFFNLQHAALTPGPSHSGFCDIKVYGLPQGDYFHHLHHRYFECNYGTPLLPLDKIFGTYRDGKEAGINLQSTEHTY